MTTLRRYIATPFIELGLLAGAAVLAGFAACATTGPRDLNADDNRAAAAAHRARAAEEMSRYDPGAVAVQSTVTTSGQHAVEVYNPTGRNRELAARNIAEARAHEKEAARLDTLDDAACAGVPEAARAACPLLGRLAVLQPIHNGARIQLLDKSMTAASAARIRCHAAFARAHGRDGLEMCPLYVEGLRVDVDGDWIVLRSPTQGRELLRLLREHLPPAPDRPHR